MVLVGIVGGIARQSLMALPWALVAVWVSTIRQQSLKVLCLQLYLLLPALKKSLAQQFQQSAPFYWAPDK